MARCPKCNHEKGASQRMADKFYKCNDCRENLIYFCAMCDKEFPQFKGLRKHVLISIARAPSQGRCSKCGKNGHGSACKLKKHLEVCHKRSKAQMGNQPYVRLVRCETQLDLFKGTKFFYFFKVQVICRCSRISVSQAGICFLLLRVEYLEVYM